MIYIRFCCILRAYSAVQTCSAWNRYHRCRWHYLYL